MGVIFDLGFDVELIPSASSRPNTHLTTPLSPAMPFGLPSQRTKDLERSQASAGAGTSARSPPKAATGGPARSSSREDDGPTQEEEELADQIEIGTLSGADPEKSECPTPVVRPSSTGAGVRPRHAEGRRRARRWPVCPRSRSLFDDLLGNAREPQSDAL